MADNSSSEDQTISLTITHRGSSHKLTLPSELSVRDLQLRLQELTEVPPELQKLLYKGKKTASGEAADVSLVDAGLKNGTKVTLMGSKIEEITAMQSTENEKHRREEIIRQRAAKGPTKLSSTSRVSSSSLSYRFHRIEPLPHLPNPEAARQVLTKLSSDPAIVHVMNQHKFSVGLLTELAPHEHPQLLGLNENAGQAIKLRLRTNEYDGMRTYRETRRVLLHELTHNVWGEHGNDFKELNSQLNREVDAFERAAKAGTHSLSGLGNGAYEPVDTDDAPEVHSHVLGGTSNASDVLSDNRDAMRQRMLEASLQRRKLEEQEIEDRCGSDGPAALT